MPLGIFLRGETTAKLSTYAAVQVFCVVLAEILLVINFCYKKYKTRELLHESCCRNPQK